MANEISSAHAGGPPGELAMNAALPVPSNSQFAAARAFNPLDGSPQEFRSALDRRSSNRRVLIEWIRSSLVDGVDFGAVPTRGGMSKPSLRKPGAEKICGMLGVVATFPTLRDYESCVLQGRAITQILLRCNLTTPEGQFVAEGVGARHVEQDYGVLNNALKMAEKSAMIDATLRMAGLSEIFTQDIEDMPPQPSDARVIPAVVNAIEQPPQAQHHERPTADYQPANSSPPRRPFTNSVLRTASTKQVNLIAVRLDQSGVDRRALCEKFGIGDITELLMGDVDRALNWIKEAGGGY